MVEISKRIEIDMGHRLPNHSSKCRNFHGHRYVFEAFVDGHLITKEGDSSEGMVIDFTDLKEVMVEVIDTPLDHGFMMSIDDPYAMMFHEWGSQDGMKVILVDFIPTVENIGSYIFRILGDRLEAKGIRLTKLIVWETPNGKAIITK
jgi:6-pyruvoyltetrahydropterin/6-carboxytetrahydropterin synthase